MSDLTPDVQAALDNLRTVNWDHLGAGELADAEQLVVERIQSAYRSALAGETEQETLVKAVREAVRKAQEIAADSPYGGIDLFYARLVPTLAPILRAPLLLQLQDKNERIKELEKELNRERGDAARLAFELAVETGAIDLERDAP